MKILKEAVKIMSSDNVKIIELAHTLKAWPQVLRHSIRLAEMTDDEVSVQLEIDRGTFSRILKGEANFPLHKLKLFCEIVGHDLPLQWLAYQNGYELRVIPKTLEEKVEAQAKEIEALKEKLSYAESLLCRVPSSETPINPRFKKEAN